MRAHLLEREREIVLPEWIMDPQIKAEATQMLTYAEKYMSFDMNDTVLIPNPIYRGPDFEERLREVADVDLLIEKDQQALKDIAN